MDWNIVLFWNAVLIAGLALARMLRGPARAWDWVAVCAVTLGVTVAGWWLFPGWAGYVGGALVAVFLIAPGLVRWHIQARIQSERWTAARRLAQVARWLHPAGVQWHESALLRGYEAAGRGDRALALEIFGRYAALPGRLGLAVRTQVWRLRHEWEQIVAALGDETARAGNTPDQISLRGVYLRALGETGRLDELVAAYRSHQHLLDRPGYEMLRSQSRLILLSFTGERAGLETLLASLPHPPRAETREFLLGTAELVAGEADEARARLEPLTRSANAITAEAARWRLEGGLAGRAALLPPETRAYLASVIAEAGHETRLSQGNGAAGRRAPVATYALLALNLLMYAAELAMSGGFELSGETFDRLGAVVTEDFGRGDTWRLLAANFLHAGTAHLAFNMLALVLLGRFVERMCGAGRLLLIYLVSGVGALGGVVLFARLGWIEDGVVVGASGAILGLVGAHGAIFWREYRTHGARVAGRQLRAVISIVVIQVLFDRVVPHVSGTAHLTGLGIGFVTTALLLRLRREPALA